jgi:DNA-binding MarR family transcriptional regulator
MVEPTDESLRAWRLFLQAHGRLLDVLESALRAEVGLPLTWYEVLLFLSRAPGGRLRMTDLAASVLVSRSGLTRIVDRMKEAGLIERALCPSDRRGVFVVITGRGRDRLRAAAPVHLKGVQDHFLAHLTAAEARAVESALARVLESLPAPV